MFSTGTRRRRYQACARQYLFLNNQYCYLILIINLIYIAFVLIEILGAPRPRDFMILIRTHEMFDHIYIALFNTNTKADPDIIIDLLAPQRQELSISTL